MWWAKILLLHFQAQAKYIVQNPSKMYRSDHHLIHQLLWCWLFCFSYRLADESIAEFLASCLDGAETIFEGTSKLYFQKCKACMYCDIAKACMCCDSSLLIYCNMELCSFIQWEYNSTKYSVVTHMKCTLVSSIVSSLS